MTQSIPSTSVPARFAYIDALRGFAALLVLVFHCLIRTSNQFPEWAKNLIEQGARGVQLFYVVSAFTIFYTLAARRGQERHPLRDFFIRRFFRIAPLFYCAIVFYLWLYGLGPRWALGDQSSVTLANVISNFLFINGFNPYWINSVVPVGWSVTVEVTFYCCIPLLFVYLKNLSRSLWFTFLALMLSIVLNSVLASHPLISDRRLWNEFLFQWFFNQLPVFGVGVVLFFLLTQQHDKVTHDQASAHAPVLTVISIFLLLALPFGRYQYLPKHFLYALAFALLTYSLAFHPLRIFVNSITMYLGKISYSLYLTHVLAIRLAVSCLESSHWSAFLAVTLLIAVGISTITFYLIERPGQQLGSRLLRRLNAYA